jgi:hypothetical protein
VNDYLIFFGLGVFCGIVISLQGAVMLAQSWRKKEGSESNG